MKNEGLALAQPHIPKQEQKTGEMPYVPRALVPATLPANRRESRASSLNPQGHLLGSGWLQLGKATGHPRPFPHPPRRDLRPALHPSIWPDIHQCQSLAAKAIFINHISKPATNVYKETDGLG